MEIVRARTDAEIDRIRSLFTAYAQSLDFDLGFQGFEAELATLPGKYAPPDGELLLALVDGSAAGCVAVRNLGDGTCEMKRLFVLPAHRGLGLGSELAKAIVAVARERGYARMRLDTIDTMHAAIALYRALGFREIAAYTHNPLPGAAFFELIL